MASENSDLNLELDGDLNLDANLDDLSLDDDELFADLDNEVRLDGDEVRLDGDVEAATDTADTADAGGDIDLGEDIALGIEEGEVPSNGNGSGGGDDLDLGGDIDLSGDVDMGADLDLGGDVDLDGDIDLDLGGDIDLAGDVDLEADLDLGGDLDGDLDLELDAAPQATEDVEAGGDELDLGGDLDGDLDLGSDADLGGDIDLDSDTDLDVDVDLDLEGDLDLGSDADLGGDAEPDLDLTADTGSAEDDLLDLDEDTAAGTSILDEELELPAATPGLEATEDAGDGEFGLGSDIDLEAELDVSLGGENDLTGDELEMDDLFEVKDDSPSGAVESTDAGEMDLDELSDLDLEAPEDPELTFGEEEDGVDVDDLALEDISEEEEDEILSVAADDLGLEEEPFEAALDVDLDTIDLDQEVIIEPSPAPAGAPEGDDPEIELESMEDVSLDDEPFEAVPDVQVDDADLESLGDLEPASLGMDDPFQSALEEDSISFEEATDVGEWDDGGNGSFTAVPDVKIHEEEVIELNLDDLDRPTTLGGMTPRSVDLPMETPQGPPPAPRMPAPPVSDPNAAVDTSMLMSIPRKLNVEMGQVSLNGHEIMELSYGSIVQLSRTVGDPVELVLEGRPIARGEIVLINGKNLGVRILSLNK